MTVRLSVSCSTAFLISLGLAGCVSSSGRSGAATDDLPVADGRAWLAGDHHIHSEFSVDYSEPAPGSNEVPQATLGADGRYSIPMNAWMARQHGLRWIVATDHGGPNHSKLNFEQSYPALLRARKEVPEVIQFYGMEFDTPGADHSSMIIPRSEIERTTLRDIESKFAKRDAFPRDASRDTEPKMLDALRFMRGLQTPPVVIANHPSRSATGVGVYGQDKPSEFRDWNDTAPSVAIGMEGAPGHQASALNKNGSIDTTGARGGYRNSPTLGGFDQMTARVGGFWDSMLGEGRRWYITSTSDSHSNWRDGGSDFWPGEYSKTYVRAAATHDDVLDGLRNGRIFVTTGDLIAELDVIASSVTTSTLRAQLGGELSLPAPSDVRITVRVRDPDTTNFHGDNPRVARVDLIIGEITGRVTDRTADVNPTTKVVKRFTRSDWRRDGNVLTMSHILRGVSGRMYVRVRGTSGNELEPTPDALGEDPWKDLWFYSNPLFISVPK